jgi:hypothetical protein
MFMVIIVVVMPAVTVPVVMAVVIIEVTGPAVPFSPVEVECS